MSIRQNKHHTKPRGSLAHVQRSGQFSIEHRQHPSSSSVDQITAEAAEDAIIVRGGGEVTLPLHKSRNKSNFISEHSEKVAINIKVISS